MPQKVLKFGGINRSINEFNSAGQCEELINLRPVMQGGYRVTKIKRGLTKFSSALSCFYEHSFGNVTNFIAVTNEGEVIWVNDNIIRKDTLTQFNSTNIGISHANDVLVIYNRDSNEQVAYKFDIEKTEYKPYYTAPISMLAWIDYRSESGDVEFVSSSAYVGRNSDDDTSVKINAYSRALDTAASSFTSIYKNGLCGVSVVGCTYVLDDNSEMWSSAFVVADFEKARISAPSMSFKPYYSIADDGLLYKTVVYGNKTTTYCLGWSGKMEGVKKINVYASRPLLRYRYVDHMTERSSILSLDKLNLDSQLMYYQGSIDVSGDKSLILDFSPEMYGETIMPVTAGAIERTGEIVSLNNRFHYYRSDVKHIIQRPTVSEQADILSSTSYWSAYVEFDGKWKLIDHLYTFSKSNPQDFIYPMAGIKKMAFVNGSFVDGEYKVDYNKVCYVSMKDSRSYNYSYAFDVMLEFVSGDEAKLFHDKLVESGQLVGKGTDDKVHIRTENNIINVSMPFNPFAFSVDSSYTFSGEIMDVVPSYIPISATQINQFPITIFTNNGIYAFEQGTKDVLYSGISTIQPLSINGKALATPHGIFFVSSKNLYVLDGREAINISGPLNGDVELNIRDLESYKLLCCTEDSKFYDFTDVLSNKNFRDFIMESNMIYDVLNNEVIISNENALYSYVLNIDSKSFYKCSGRYLRSQSGARRVLFDEELDGKVSVVDMYDEKDSSSRGILLQSRPLSLEELYSHLQRMILHVDANLEGKQYLCLSVFGSNNLYDWKCIISAQKTNTVLRQIRTNKAAKSYRDYVILITGVIDTNTDISDIIADYTVVNRRLG